MTAPTCTVTARCLVALMLLHQVLCGPMAAPDDQTGSPPKAASQRREVRMTPLWRIMGSKPHGAYCQDHYECSTRICRDGHCSFTQTFNSRK
ncbi:liver-expressed antimicrobial peptide 2-like [Megalops cyprinoides]|uniref:liver-expressed antimicrobial peptide 2-like n=1 Tax=Megalops cyprinoides TaxID=118141 RepID=UPI001864ADE8|nr:liver-expressed antimicrobial peptide 2-like [Megalops cyprinoides]